MEITTNTLDEIRTLAKNSCEEESSKYLQFLKDLGEHIAQAINDAKEKFLAEKEDAIIKLTTKLEESFISELVQKNSSVTNLQRSFLHLKAHFQSEKWFETYQYSLPQVENFLPMVKICDTVVEDQVNYFNNLVKLENEGSTIDPYLVEAIEVVTPSEFYILRHCDKERKKALDHLLNNCRFNRPSEIEPGKIYAVYVQRWKSWFRAQCYEQCGNFHVGNGPSQILYECFLFDEGRHEKIPSLQFGILPKELIRPKAFALSCRLHEFPNRKWTPNEIQLFQKLAARSPLNLFIYGEEPGQLTVDLGHIPRYLDDKYVHSFRDMMMMQQGGPVSSLKKKVFRQKIVRSETGTSFEGVVKEVLSPFKIYVDLDGLDGKEYFNEMMAQLEAECNDPMSDVLLAVSDPKIDYCYACRWGRDCRWFRVVVEDRTPQDRLTLFFVDTGHRWTTPLSSASLRQLPEKYMEMPAQVSCCKLDSITYERMDRKYFSQNAIDFLRGKLINEQVNVFIRGSQPGDVGAANRRETCLFVVIFVGDEDKSVNRMLCEARHARSLRKLDDAVHNRRPPKQPSPILSVDSVNMYTPPVTPSPATVDMNTITASDTPKSSWLDSLAASGCEVDKFSPSFKEELCSEAPISPRCHFSATSSKTADSNEQCTEQSKIELKAEEASIIFEDMQLPEKQVALARSHSWKTEGRRCDKFVPKNGTMPNTNDYAIDVVLLSCISPESLYVRPLIYQNLYNWLQVFMNREYEKHQKVKKPKFDIGFPCAVQIETGKWIRGAVSDISGDVCTVSCWDDGQDYVVSSDCILPLLEPFDRIPHLVLRCSLSRVYPIIGRVWDRSVGVKITSILQEAEEIVVFTDDHPASLNSPLKIQLVYKYDSEGGPLEIPGKSLVNLNEKLIEMELASAEAKTTIKEWPTTPPIPVPDEFSAHITWLNLDGDIYIYNVEHSEDILKEMQTSFDMKFQNSRPSCEDMKFQIGEVCIARYALDGSWYRAIIEAVGERPNKVSVRFTDYGTTEFVDETDIRKDIAFEAVPAQTIKCSIFNLQPVITDDNDTWTIAALDMIHPEIVETRWIAHVKRRSPLQISFVKEDGTDLAQLLVSKELAKFASPPSL